jgi:DNA-binding transcriptional LysR family regulator
MTRLLTGHLSIGVTRTPGPLDVAALLYEFHALHAGVELSVREGLSVVIADELRTDELDLGIVSAIPEPARRGLSLQPIAREPLVLIVPPGHKLAGTKRLAVDKLAGEPLVLFPAGATIRETFEALAAQNDLEPRVVFETGDTLRMRELVSIGLGIGLLPRSDAHRPGPAVATAAIAGTSLEYELFVATRARRRQSRATVAMTEMLAAHAR